MAKKLDAKETVDFEQVILSEVIQSEALTNLLEQKGILTRGELLEEVKRVADKLPKAESQDGKGYRIRYTLSRVPQARVFSLSA